MKEFEAQVRKRNRSQSKKKSELTKALKVEIIPEIKEEKEIP